jgi:O-antigen/teichoic acid export membrane protein
MSDSVTTSGRVLARNAAFNLAGHVLPLLLALLLLPFVLGTLGAERFAILTLAWTIIGYFGFFDLGLGRAATRFVAGSLGAGRPAEVRRVTWSALAVQSVLGLIGALLIAAVAGPLTRLLHISDPVLLQETSATLVMIGIGLPVVLLSGTMSGVLEAYQRFDLVNLIRVPANCATLAVPAVGAMFGWSLPVIIFGIVVTRAVGLLCFAMFAARVTGDLRPMRPHAPTLRQLLVFGGWLTVSLFAGPVLAYAERLLIGGMRSLTELAYYAVAFEIAVRTTLLPAAAAVTLFPAYSYVQQSGRQIGELFRRSARVLLLLQWPLLVVLWLFPVEILTAWMNASVAAAAAPALRLLAVSFFFNGLAHLALAGVLGLGRPDLKAKLDVVEVPFYLASAALLIGWLGITGAAAAKLLVTLLDTAMLFVFARRLGASPFASAEPLRVRARLLISAAVLILLTVAVTRESLLIRIIAAFLVIVVLGAAYWKVVLESRDRAALLGFFLRTRLKEAV